MNLSVLDAENNNHFLQMGCYGIGVTRIIAAAIEQNHDDNGIMWPESITPFDVVIIEIDGYKNENIRNFSNEVYETLSKLGVDVILDDRNAKLGNKLHDWELIGVPRYIIIGRTETENKQVTYKLRGDSNKEILNLDNVCNIFTD